MNPKERYEKPVLEIIELKAEEVLGVYCKNTPGNNVSGISVCGSAVGCNQPGS
jgi:hypothetical protein